MGFGVGFKGTGFGVEGFQVWGCGLGVRRALEFSVSETGRV